MNTKKTRQWRTKFGKALKAMKPYWGKGTYLNSKICSESNKMVMRVTRKEYQDHFCWLAHKKNRPFIETLSFQQHICRHIFKLFSDIITQSSILVISGGLEPRHPWINSWCFSQCYSGILQDVVRTRILNVWATPKAILSLQKEEAEVVHGNSLSERYQSQKI